ncbi:MAG: tetratricopeptide repeat protein [Prolixibacteraceae bacterium]|nr:tetratricopeptide repeat protein [Prolixibacteraceae bacterium]
MIRKSEYYELTDRYLDNELSQSEVRDFEIQMEFDSDLADELNLQLDVNQAVAENEIINLRNTLNQITQNQEENQLAGVLNAFSFGLSEEFSSFNKLASQAGADLQNITHSFPKIHLYQHQVAGKENIHQFYKEQGNTDSMAEEEAFSAYEEEIFSQVQNALEESDILDIRANLKQIAQSRPAHQYSTEDIDSYVHNQMESDYRILFENELAVNPALAHDVQLIKEIDLACQENDIISLRASLVQIQKAEFNPTSRIEEIEGYIYNELSEEEMASFEAEFTANKDLADEIQLVRNVDRAIAENDVMNLRNSLRNIAGSIAAEKQTQQSIFNRFIARKVIISSVAASLILLLGITGLLTRQASDEKLYQKFYAAYQTTGINRSAVAGSVTNQNMTTALQLFDNKDYENAAELFNKVIAQNPNDPAASFYAGAALQQIGKYPNAINRYMAVIENRDNMFFEQAQWYIGLCYLQTNETKKAYKQFKKIAENQGFYQEKAQAIIRKMKPES